MDSYQEFAIGVALMRLEEELNLLRQIVFNLPSNMPSEELYNLLNKGLLILKISTDILSTLNPEQEENQYIVKDVTSEIFESIFLVQTLFEKSEKRLPIFWEQFTVFEEPLLEKLNQITHTLHEALNEENMEKVKNIDFGELAYILQDIVKTLEVALQQTKTIKEKVL